MLSEEILTSFTCFTNEIRGDQQALHTCKMEGSGRIGACPWWEGVGREGLAPPPPPPPRKWKKEAVRGNFNRFHLCFTNKVSGDRHTLHTCKMEGGGRTGACPWWKRVGALPPPPPRKWKERLSEEILTSFTYVLLMKLGCGRYTIHAKWKRVCGQALVHGGRGWGGRGGFAPIENEKRKGEYRPISTVGDE